MSVTSSIQPVGHDVTLTCTVELSPVVDIPVTVNIVWTGPNGIMFMSNDINEQIAAENNNIYTSTGLVRSFGRIDSGNYICTATIMAVKMSQYRSESGAVASNEIRLTIGI